MIQHAYFLLLILQLLYDFVLCSEYNCHHLYRIDKDIIITCFDW